MKLTNDERKALEGVRNPAGVFSKPVAQILKRLADLGLCEVAPPMLWQRADPQTCPLAIAVITAAGRNALRNERRRQAPARELEVCNA